MMDDFKHKGRWWLPADPDTQVEGTLTYSPADGPILALSGAFGDLRGLIGTQGLSSPRLILGTTASGQQITLLDCAQKHRSVGSGYPTSSYHVRAAFVGSHFQSYDDITFESLRVHYSYLDGWAALRHFEHLQEQGVTTLSYTRPEPIVAQIDDGLKILLISTGSEQWRGSPPTRVTIEREASIGIQIGEEAHFAEFPGPIRLLQIFLSLAVGASVRPVNLTATRRELVRDNLVPRPVDIFYQPPRDIPPQKTLFAADMTFTRTAISDRFESFLHNWFETAKSLEPVLNLYFVTLAETGMFAEHCFLSLTRALESFHRCRYGGQYLSGLDYEPAYDQLIAAIPDSIATDHRAALAARLKYGHQFSLRKRLADIFSAHDEVLNGLCPDIQAFIHKVVTTRNYLTHYDEDDRQDAGATGIELHRLVSRLRIALEACLLAEIGFSAREQRRMVRELLSRRTIEPIIYQ